MPVPKFMAHVNKRVFNKLELRKGTRPVLTHVGRSSGSTFRTPLDAHPVDGGYIFIALYGADSDWVRNILAAGTALLTLGDDEFDLVNPRVVSKDVAWPQMAKETKEPPKFLRVTEFLQMDTRS